MGEARPARYGLSDGGALGAVPLQDGLMTTTSRKPEPLTDDPTMVERQQAVPTKQ